MMIADRNSMPLAVFITRASPHELTLVNNTLDAMFVDDVPQRLIGDRAYDSDPLDEQLLADRGIIMIAPHRKKRKKPPTQDGRALRRNKRRWTVERVFAWLGYFRRFGTRWERHSENYLTFLLLGCSLILMRRVLKLGEKKTYKPRKRLN